MLQGKHILSIRVCRFGTKLQKVRDLALVLQTWIMDYNQEGGVTRGKFRSAPKKLCMAIIS